MVDGTKLIAAQAVDVRQPQQQRTIQGWQRVLDVAGQVLAERGSDGLTIAVVCERAGVAPSALYARVRNRNDLLLAAFEHMQQNVVESEERLDEIAGRPRTANSTREVVAALVAIVSENAAYLRAAILSSGSNEELARRAAAHVERLERRFLLALVGHGASRESLTAGQRAFSAIFSTLIVLTAYGAQFTRGPELGDPALIDDLEGIVAHTIRID